MQSRQEGPKTSVPPRRPAEHRQNRLNERASGAGASKLALDFQLRRPTMTSRQLPVPNFIKTGITGLATGCADHGSYDKSNSTIVEKNFASDIRPCGPRSTADPREMICEYSSISTCGRLTRVPGRGDWRLQHDLPRIAEKEVRTASFAIMSCLSTVGAMAVVERIQLLRNVGKFDSVIAGGRLPFSRITLVFAENGRGKTIANPPAIASSPFPGRSRRPKDSGKSCYPTIHRETRSGRSGRNDGSDC